MPNKSNICVYCAHSKDAPEERRTSELYLVCCAAAPTPDVEGRAIWPLVKLKTTAVNFSARRTNQKKMNVLDQRRLEFKEAVERSIAYQLLAVNPNLCAPPRLPSSSIRSEIATICFSVGIGRSTGLCQFIVSACIEKIKQRLDCQAWMVFGWLSDIAKPGSYFWKMDADTLCEGLSKGWLGYAAEFHTWVILDSGEIIDPVVYPTLAENFKQFSRGAGRCNILHPEGRPYKATIGLPLLEYHPLAVME